MSTPKSLHPRQHFESPYTATTYVAHQGSRRIALRVGGSIPEELLSEGESEWAYITAWNPASNLRSAKENEAAQERLRQVLRGRGLRFLEGMSEPDDGSTGEGSLLVFMSPAEALGIAKQFGQNAILVGSRSQPATLLWTGD